MIYYNSSRGRNKIIPKKCDMRKCRNWQTSKTKDLVSIALVWVQVPSSAFTVKTVKKLLTNLLMTDILKSVAREKQNNPEEMRYAEVSELADEQD